MKPTKIPLGFCQCGCGLKTNIAKRTQKGRGQVRGTFMRFVKAHNKGHILHGQSGTAGKTRLNGTSKKPTSEYSAWHTMIQRCENPRNKAYARYGKRGIKVCKKWRRNFSAFLNDVGPKPRKGMYIDRSNNNGNYEPGNCKWVTPKKSAQNRTNKHSHETRLKISIGVRKTKAKKN